MFSSDPGILGRSWEGYWDGNGTPFLGHASKLIKVDEPGLRMHPIRQGLEVDRSGADLPDTAQDAQGTQFSNNDHQRPRARKQ